MQEQMGVVPKALQNRPTLSQRWHYPKKVFDDLTGSRSYSFGGEANIPISEFDVYAKGYGFTQLEWQEVWEDLAIIDTIWLSEVAKKRKAATKGT